MPNTTTLLDIDIPGVSFSDYALRDLTCTIEKIAQAGRFKRNLNGRLISLGLPQFDKHRLSISCDDHESPPFDQIPLGTLATVTLLPQLGTNETDTSGAQVQMVLDMMVVSWRGGRREYQAQSPWELVLEEV